MRAKWRKKRVRRLKRKRRKMRARSKHITPARSQRPSTRPYRVMTTKINQHNRIQYSELNHDDHTTRRRCSHDAKKDIKGRAGAVEDWRNDDNELGGWFAGQTPSSGPTICLRIAEQEAWLLCCS
ncbi:hypothetical protein F4805DRAFT_454568 [Annulohypoxylon moriforme]|nr:hypothetical protein F4805DRAFT_454568 [Annulohypoxylon moriforme]